MICTLTAKDGVANWCERHKRHHHGHYAQYAVDPGEKGEQFRKFWDGQLRDNNPPKLLRSLPLASQCRHLDPHRLTNDEAAAANLSDTAFKLNTSCRACSQKTSLQRCHGGGGVDGYTTLAHCAGRCVDKFELKTIAKAEHLPVNGSWITSPAVWPMFKKMIAEEIANYQPQEPGTGDGIVIVGGGKYFASTYCNIRLIRHHGCKLPIELWYLGSRNEMPSKWQDIVAPYGVVCRDADEQAKVAPMRILNGWELKFYAIQQSSFRRVIFVDADCFPMRDPAYLLHDPYFLGSGAVFQRDCSAYDTIKPEVLAMFGIQPRQVWDIESGACLIDKQRWGLPLHITVFLNSYSDLVYKVVYGDKTTPALASLLTGKTYAIPSHQPKGGGWGLMQKWFDGSDMWQHRIHAKPTLNSNDSFISNQKKVTYSIAWWNEINSFLNNLRGLLK